MRDHLTQSDLQGLLAALDQTALVSVTDVSGKITYANETFAKVSEYSLNELLGQNHRILKSGHQPDTLFDDLWRTISHGQVWRGEIKNRAKDGSYYWVDTSIAPILNEKGIPDHYISVRFLITDRKEKERDYLAALEALNKTALVSMTDVKGNIFYANDMFVEVSKYSREELIGQNHRILKSGHQPDTLFDDLWRTISHGHVWRGEIKNRAKDGSYYWVDTAIAPIINPIGAPERYIAIRFLSTEHNLEEEMTKFVSIASHQLRTPLTAIRWSIERLQQKMLKGDKVINEEFIIPTRAINQMSNVINAMLTMTRVQSGKLNLIYDTVRIKPLLTKIANTYATAMETAEQSMVIDCPVDLTIKTDERLLTELLGNLVDNASRYSPSKSRITLRARAVNRHIDIEVQDEGYGIPTSDHERVFTLFFQAKNVKGNTGLGLYLVRLFVDALSGRVRFTSKEKRGTTFIVSLPVEPPVSHIDARKSPIQETVSSLA